MFIDAWAKVRVGDRATRCDAGATKVVHFYCHPRWQIPTPYLRQVPKLVNAPKKSEESRSMIDANMLLCADTRVRREKDVQFAR